jgi:hypothetical protein
MSDEVKNNPAQVGDGFDDLDNDGSKSIIKGTKVKFTNSGEWLDDFDEVIAADREFIVIKVIKVSQKWIDGLPAETRILAPDEPFPDVDRLNGEAPRTEWREAFGRKVGPWQNSYVTYLLDPRAMGGFTFVTSTTGGFRAIHDLKEDTRRARMMRGPNMFPLVVLGAVFMKTQYGGRQRPCFKVKGFIALGADNTAPPLEQKPGHAQLDDPAKAKPSGSKNSDLNDEISW